MTEAPAAASSWPAMTLAQVNARLTAPGAPFEMEQVVIRGVDTRVWKNAPPTLRDILAAGRTHRDRTFLVYEDERATFDAFHRAVAAFAAELRAAGVEKGDRVALIMRNLPEWPVALYAAVALGAIITPLNGWWTAPELEYGLSDSGSKVAVMDAERYARLAEHLSEIPSLERVYVSRAEEPIAHPKVRHLEQVIGETEAWPELPDAELPDADVSPDDPATIFYTSGTTGRPKGALGTHRNVSTNIMSSLFSLARTHLRRGEAPPVADPDGSSTRVADLHSVLPRHRLLGVDEPGAGDGRQARDDAQVGPGARLPADRARAGDHRGRRAHHRLAADRAPGAGRLRPVQPGDGGLRRRALGFRAGAQDRRHLRQRPALATAGA